MKMHPIQEADGIDRDTNFQFPGRWIGGVSLCIAPLIFLTGILLRIQFHFFFPQQLAAFNEHPALIVASYNCFVIGNILLYPAVITLANYIGKTKSQLALWGGCFVIFGLFARTFHAGVDHLAFQLVRVQGLQQTQKAVADAYGGFNIIATLNGTILFGWLLLAAGAYLSKIFGLFRSISLAAMSLLMIGVLKGSSWVSVIAATGLCIAFIPMGIRVLKDGSAPGFKKLITQVLLVIVIIAILYFLGQQG